MRERISALAIAALCAMSPGIQAQPIYKCRQPNGQIEYKNTPCTENNAMPISSGSMSTVDAMPQHEIQRLNRPPPPPVYYGGSHAEGPSDLEIRNMRVGANSITLSKRERMVRQADIAAAEGAQRGGSGIPDYSAVAAEDRRAAARRQAAASAAAAAAAAKPNPTFMSCNGNRCSDNAGNSYSRQPFGGTWTRSDGKFCHPSGNMMSCN